MLGARTGTLNKFHNTGPQILYATVQTSFATVTWRRGVTHH